jgi:hypothetical protein
MGLFGNKRSHFPLLLNPPIVGAGSRPSLLISINLAKPAPNAIAILQETGFLIKLIATNQDILRNPVSESDRNTPRNRVSN